MYDLVSVHSAAEEYKHKAKVLRQIHSQKLSVASRLNVALNVITIFVSAAVTFFSFFGVTRIQAILLPFLPAETVEFLFSLTVLAILIISLIQLTGRAGERVADYLSVVKLLTEFIVDMDDILRMTQLTNERCESAMDSIGHKYKAACRSLPASSDSDWRRAKKVLGIKEKE